MSEHASGGGGLNKLVILVLIVIGALLAWSFLKSAYEQSTLNHNPNATTSLNMIKSFEDCERAGYSIMESHPRQCSLPDGRVYAEEIVVEPTYENASDGMIRVTSPHPGAVVGKEFRVVGEARGNWFFEASFPIEIVSPSGQVIGGTIATAQGEWMTTDFVPFMSEMVDLPSAYIGPATLILRKDNPSGLPENDASVSIPITVEY